MMSRAKQGTERPRPHLRRAGSRRGRRKVAVDTAEAELDDGAGARTPGRAAALSLREEEESPTTRLFASLRIIAGRSFRYRSKTLSARCSSVLLCLAPPRDVGKAGSSFKEEKNCKLNVW